MRLGIFLLAAAGLLHGQLPQWPATQAVTGVSSANTALTVTLPAVSGQFHYITSIRIQRTCTAALVGSAVLTVTTTNLPGNLAYTMGNACLIGSTNNDLVLDLAVPLRSSAPGTATTIVCPAAGAAVICRITALYYSLP